MDCCADSAERVGGRSGLKGFIKFPRWLFEMEPPLSRDEIAVYIMFLRFAEFGKEDWRSVAVGVRRLQSELRMNRGDLIEVIHGLEGRGILRVILKGIGRRPSVYEVFCSLDSGSGAEPQKRN